MFGTIKEETVHTRRTHTAGPSTEDHRLFLGSLFIQDHVNYFLPACILFILSLFLLKICDKQESSVYESVSSATVCQTVR